MGKVEISPGETKQIVSEPVSNAEYKCRVTGADVSLSHSPRQTVNNGTTIAKGDRFELSNLQGGSVYAKNVGSDPAEIEIDQAGFAINFWPRSVQGTVNTSSENDAAPSTDSFRHFNDTGADVNAAAVSHAFKAPDRADFVVIHVDDADGAFTVHVEYTDPDGNVQTSVTGNDNADLSGDSATDVLTRVAIASPDARVRITDDSGVANTLDYNIYAR